MLPGLPVRKKKVDVFRSFAKEFLAEIDDTLGECYKQFSGSFMDQAMHTSDEWIKFDVDVATETRRL